MWGRGQGESDHKKSLTSTATASRVHTINDQRGMTHRQRRHVHQAQEGRLHRLRGSGEKATGEQRGEQPLVGKGHRIPCHPLQPGPLCLGAIGRGIPCGGPLCLGAIGRGVSTTLRASTWGQHNTGSMGRREGGRGGGDACVVMATCVHGSGALAAAKDSTGVRGAILPVTTPSPSRPPPFTPCMHSSEPLTLSNFLSLLLVLRHVHLAV